jgi:hypothetical protein
LQNTAPQPGPFPIYSEFNGDIFITEPSIWHQILLKVVIADAGDALLDSGVFFKI